LIDIRLLGPGDESVLARVADTFDDPIDTRAAGEFLNDPRHHIAVAIDEGVVVGFVSAVLYVHPDKPRPELWINEVGVAPSHHRRGIAGKLLEAVLDAGRDADCTEAWVLTDRANEAAMKLYASVGGKEAPDDQVMFTFHLRPERPRTADG
jgi:aminoglycoside 6'-N-acetyltransferase I